MSTPEVTVATPDDRAPVVAAMVAAFARDPALRYLFPDDRSYPQHAAAYLGQLFDRRVEQGTVWTIDRGGSTAIWQAPTAGAAASEPDPYPYPGDTLARVRAYDRALYAALPPAPFWYLGVLATRPDCAGRGWGRAVMRAGLARVAADGLPAVLETSNPANVELYRRAGWEVIRSVTAPVPIWIMQQRPVP